MNSSGFKLSSASGQPLLSFGQRSSSAYSRGYPSAADQIDSSATGQARPILTTSSQCPAGGKQPQKQSSMVNMESVCLSVCLLTYVYIITLTSRL